MKKINIKIILFLLAIFFLFFPINVSADIYDYADILTDEEEKELQSLLKENEKKIRANIIIYTLSTGRYIDDAVDDWYMDNCPTKYKGSVIYAIDMSSRTTLIKGYDGMSHLDFDDDDSLVLKTANYLKDGDNAGSVKYFIENIKSEIAKQENIVIIFTGLFNLAVSIIVMFITVKNVGGKETVNHKDYVKLDNSRIFNEKDIYLHTEIIKTRKSSSSSGGSRSGSGGHGHF